jgi:hypothetical protein
MRSYAHWFLGTIDNFSLPVQLLFNKEKSFSTIYGGILTIIIYSVIISLSINTIFDLFNKTSSRILMTNTHYTVPPLINVTKSNLFLATYFFGNDAYPFYDPSYFSLSINQYRLIHRTDGTLQIDNFPLSIINCTNFLDKFTSKEMEDQFKTNNLDKGLCFDMNDILIGGSFTSDYFSTIRMTIKKCENKTESDVPCKSLQEIDKKMLAGYFHLYFIDKNINANNYTHPFSDYVTNYYMYIDPNAYRFSEIYFKVVNITSDVGLMFEEKEEISEVSLDYYREFTGTTNNNNILIDAYIGSSPNVLYYNRVYLKVQDIAATLGGLLKIMLFVGQILSRIPTQFRMYEFMINTLFHIPQRNEFMTEKIANVKDQIRVDTQNFKSYFKPVGLSSKIANKNSDPKKENSDIKITSQMNVFNSIKQILHDENKLNNKKLKILANKKEHEQINSQTDINRSNTILNRKINQLKSRLASHYDLSVKSLISIICSKFYLTNNHQYKLFKTIFAKLNNYLDYLKIVTILLEFQKLKKIIFNKTQRKLFSTVSPAVINEKTLNKYEDGYLEPKLNYEKIYNSYLKAGEKAKDRKFYQKVIDNFDGNLKIIFDEMKTI